MRFIKLVTTIEIKKDRVRFLLRVIETNKLHTDLYRSIESYHQDDIFDQIKKKLKSFGPVSKYQVFVFGTQCFKIKDVLMFLIQRLLTSL